MSNLTRNTITSMEVAEMVGKEHSKLLRDIRNYVSQLAEAKIGLGDFFTEATYKDANNQMVHNVALKEERERDEHENQ